MCPLIFQDADSDTWSVNMEKFVIVIQSVIDKNKGSDRLLFFLRFFISVYCAK